MNIYKKNTGFRRAGFTLAELLLALSVMTIVLSAAAALAFAMGSAESATSKMGEQQARIRFATMRIRELARNSCLVIPCSTTGVVFWTGDANEDGMINGNEVVWLSTDGSDGAGKVVRITEFPGQTAVVKKTDLQNKSAINSLIMTSEETVTTILNDCSSVSISLQDNITTVSISLIEDGQVKELQICAAIRASANYLLTAPNSDLVSGDDDF